MKSRLALAKMAERALTTKATTGAQPRGYQHALTTRGYQRLSPIAIMFEMSGQLDDLKNYGWFDNETSTPAENRAPVADDYPNESSLAATLSDEQKADLEKYGYQRPKY